LAVDDEPHIRQLLSVTLTGQGLQILLAADGAEALERLQGDAPDLVLLDLGLPDIDGFELLQQIRQRSTVPIIIVTVRNEEADRIRGLELGADDYLSKPFSTGELGARIHAVLRRTTGMRTRESGLVTVDDRLQIDLDEKEVIVAGQRVHLRPTEYRLLYELVQSPGRTIPFQTILARVWGPEYQDEVHYVHLYVTYLRQKIEPDSAHPRYILSRRGLGYQFRALEPQAGSAPPGRSDEQSAP